MPVRRVSRMGIRSINLAYPDANYIHRYVPKISRSTRYIKHMSLRNNIACVCGEGGVPTLCMYGSTTDPWKACHLTSPCLLANFPDLILSGVQFLLSLPPLVLGLWLKSKCHSFISLSGHLCAFVS